MAIQVNLAAHGIAGVTGLTAAQITSANNGQNLAVNSVVAATGSANVNVNLPLPGTGENFAGQVIVVKNILDAATPALTLTIAGETRGSDTVPIDSDTTLSYDIGRLDAVSFYYINDTIGWMAGPAHII